MENARVAEANENLRVGREFLRDHDLESAWRHLSEACSLFGEANDLVGRAQAHLGLGDTARLQSQRGSSIANYSSARQLFRDLDDRVGEARALEGAAALAMDVDDLPTAQELLDEALSIADGIEEANLESRLRYRRGQLASLRSDTLGAEQDLSLAIQLANSAGNPQLEANALLLLGIHLNTVSKLQDAHEHLAAALSLYSKIGDGLGHSNASLLLGIIAHRRSDFEASSQHLSDALSMSEDLGDLLGIANAHLQLAVVARRLSDYAMAEEHLAIALPLFEEIGDRRSRSYVEIEYGSIAHVKRDLDAAEDWFLRALETARQLEDLLSESNILIDLASISHLKGDNRAAGERLEAALDTAKAIESRHGEGLALLGLGEVLATEGHSDRAHSSLASALQLFRDVGDPTLEAYCLADLAQLAISSNDPKGPDLLTKAADLFRSAGLQRDLALTVSDLAQVLLSRGDTAQAIEEALAGVRAVERLRATQSDPAGRVLWRRNLAKVYDIAMAVLAEASEQGVDVSWGSLEVVEAARAEVVGGLLRAGTVADADGEIQRLIEQINGYGLQLAALSARPPDSAAMEVSKETARIDRQLAEAIGTLEDRVGNFALLYAPEPLDPDEVADLVPAGTALLAFHLDTERQRLFSVWLEPDDSPHVAEVQEWEAIRSALTLLADPNSIHFKISEPHGSLMSNLSALVPDVLVNWITTHDSADPAQLLIVPTGPLWLTPWAALPIGQGESYSPLCHFSSVSIIPSLRTLPPAAAGSGSSSVLGFRDPDLAGVTEEAKALERLWNSQPFYTNPDTWRSELNDTYRLAYVGCHGDSSPGLAHRLYLSASGETVINAAALLAHTVPQLLHIGACTSGRIDIEGHEPIGIPTVAMTRGATDVLAPTSRIPDMPSAKFASQLHELLASGLHPAIALREAQASATGLPIGLWGTYAHFGWPPHSGPIREDG